ncbi:Probable 60S ribosomal protein L7,mitochondrial [Taphrina deformans PYCC 5710]|uniref:Probable 60S ribosomal protein L7,mitochondrial n=1 Tax=Taphrina deformans (strain PYCC 5710 / ATCC 11124 / CBS 356.35 / IMI 108563 / JCM 9778 / NBRC 8474) TaxID=1097556 RepID=R4XEG0_TAPDE|nr:Probable 60S ribosomal protein L7,mitochondrial [Taphrina deformans PYCC 5710]|eukprot:CCG81757.1 Probable 60S ribosomal protein L7,mitochondrial [Taphrina deformans PYCC 5710]
MTYQQHSAGEARSTKTNALRKWDDSSPYHKGRPQRPLRGGKVLKPLPEPRTFRNVPKITTVYIHTMIKEALEDRQKLLSAFMALQTISGQQPELILSRKSVAPWKLRSGVPVAVKVKLQGPPMNQFLSTLFEIILPSLKDFTGIADSTGDTNGNLAFGLPGAAMARFPEIEANYEQYPILPGFHVLINTTAPNDREARQLLTGYGLPFKKA